MNSHAFTLLSRQSSHGRQRFDAARPSPIANVAGSDFLMIPETRDLDILTSDEVELLRYCATMLGYAGRLPQDTLASDHPSLDSHRRELISL